MVRFKTRWLLLAIDDKPISCTSPSPSALDNDSASTSASTSATFLSAAQRSASTTNSTGATITPQLVTRLLRASLVYNFGDVAAGAFGGVLTCKYYSSHTGTAIVRCSRDAARLVWGAATMISSPVEMSLESYSGAGTPRLRIRVVHCGGTIKKVQNKAIELDRKMIMRLRAKQKKVVAGTTPQTISRKEAVAPPSVEVAQVPIIPIAAVDDEEDLGEALDPDAPVVDKLSSVPVPDISTQSKKPVAHKDTLDPETQALLAQSRKQINSIGM